MLKLLEIKNKHAFKKLDFFLNKRKSNQFGEKNLVKKIISQVKLKGDKAVLNYEKKFSKIRSNSNKIRFSQKLQ